MPVKEIDGKWHTVNKAGKVGKRGFRTQAGAESAQARGKALAGGTSAEITPTGPSTVEGPDTVEERKKLGIPPKPDLDWDTGGF